MKIYTRENLEHSTNTIVIDRNKYNYRVYGDKNTTNKVIIFPMFHYQGESQYIDLLIELVKGGYKVITFNMLNKGDRCLNFDYYFKIFETFYLSLKQKDVISYKDDISLMGFGISAYLVSNAEKNDLIDANRFILLSPVNRYKSEYAINRDIANFKKPTYIFYGQFDRVTNPDNRFNMFKAGKDNPNVKFNSYACTGHYLFYKGVSSMELEKLYRHGNIDMLVGEDRKNATVFLPSDPIPNELFFKHLFNALEDKKNPKRILLLTDTFPLFINGVEMVVELLQKELEKMGYETYIAALWKEGIDFNKLPNASYIPIVGSYARLVKDHEQLMLLKSFKWNQNAKMLALFGFDYMHLHSEYSMAKVGLELAKVTGIKMPYTYHTLWKIYYYNNFGPIIGGLYYKIAEAFLFKPLYKQCSTIIVPSKKSYDILSREVKHHDIRISPSPINRNNFTWSKEDNKVVTELRERYNLLGKEVIGFIGRVSKEKNITETIDYLSRIKDEMPNLMFMIVGSGDGVQYFKKYAMKLGVTDRIIFTGQVANNNLKFYYKLFNAFVTASTFETQGLTYFEAATMGTPIIAKKDKALEGIFENGKTALIYNGFDQWVERIETALYKDNKEMLANAKNKMKEYSPDKWAKEMLKIYQDANPQR